MFPVALLRDGGIYLVADAPVGFTGPDGTCHTPVIWDSWTDADWSLRCPGIAGVPVTDIPAPPPYHHAVKNPQSEWTVTPSSVTVTYTYVPFTASEMLAALADLRWRIADGGYKVGYAVIPTDPDARRELHAAHTLASLGKIAFIDFKRGPGDVIRLTADTLLEVVPETGVFRQACFSHEAELATAIAAAAQPWTVDIAAGWPANSAYLGN
jgi:hypothetical protein